MIKEKDPNIQAKTYAMNRYYAQFINDLYVRANVVWIDNKLLIPNPLTTAINNRIHYYHHGKSNTFQAAKDFWYPYNCRSISSMADNCRECTESNKNLKNLLSKQDMKKVVDPKEPIEVVQLVFGVKLII